MKKIALFLILALGIAMCFTGCGKKPDDPPTPDGGVTPTYYSVTFKQEGFSDVVKQVEEGKGLSAKDIPTPKAVTGHTVEWESVDLSAVTQDITVNAIITANKYSVVFNFATNVPQSVKDQYPEKTVEVTYGGELTLPKVTAPLGGWKIVAWKDADGKTYSDMTYLLEDGLTLFAEWEWWSTFN